MDEISVSCTTVGITGVTSVPSFMTIGSSAGPTQRAQFCKILLFLSVWSLKKSHYTYNESVQSHTNLKSYLRRPHRFSIKVIYPIDYLP